MPVQEYQADNYIGYCIRKGSDPIEAIADKALMDRMALIQTKEQADEFIALFQSEDTEQLKKDLFRKVQLLLYRLPRTDKNQSERSRLHKLFGLPCSEVRTTFEVEVKSYCELPDNAAVEEWVNPATKRRYIRWTNGDETDNGPPAVVYSAPGWVWSLYAQALARGLNLGQKDLVPGPLGGRRRP
jgi:hypothetical protein